MHPAAGALGVAAAGGLLEREVLADAGARAAGRAPGLPAALGRPAAGVAVAGHRLEAGLQVKEIEQVAVHVQLWHFSCRSFQMPAPGLMCGCCRAVSQQALSTAAWLHCTAVASKAW